MSEELVKGGDAIFISTLEETGQYFHLYFGGERHLLETYQTTTAQVFTNGSSMFSVV